MPYFRADAHLIAPMVKKDCLRYNTENVASIVCLFSIPAKGGKVFYISAIFYGDNAEEVNRLELDNLWLEVKGRMFDSTPEFESYSLPKLSLKVESFIQVPAMSQSVMRCELIGRLTREPEHISKTDSYDFVRFSLAVNRKTTNQANYFDISAFKPNLIELINNQVNKGQSVFAAGELTFFQKGNDSLVHASVKLEQLLLMQRHI